MFFYFMYSILINKLYKDKVIVIRKIILIKLLILLIIFSFIFMTISYASESLLKEKYTEEELDYFYEVAFGLEYGNNTNVIHKWNKSEIKFSITGTDEYVRELNRVIRELTELTGITFTKVDKNADIDIYFINHSDFTKHVPNNKLVENSCGYFYAWWDEDNIIYKAKVLIAIDKGVIGEQRHLIREELTQSLGLMNDSDTCPISMFYQGRGLEEEYTDIDKSIIKLLYETNIKSGMSKSKIKKLF
jgi:hypothetical protein